jgi:hypothetical protein
MSLISSSRNTEQLAVIVANRFEIRSVSKTDIKGRLHLLTLAICNNYM